MALECAEVALVSFVQQASTDDDHIDAFLLFEKLTLVVHVITL